MNRFASPVVKVDFEGPDIHEEVLYDLCRVGFIIMFLVTFSINHLPISHMVKSET